MTYPNIDLGDGPKRHPIYNQTDELDVLVKEGDEPTIYRLSRTGTPEDPLPAIEKDRGGNRWMPVGGHIQVGYGGTLRRNPNDLYSLHNGEGRFHGTSVMSQEYLDVILKYGGWTVDSTEAWDGLTIMDPNPNLRKISEGPPDSDIIL